MAGIVDRGTRRLSIPHKVLRPFSTEMDTSTGAIAHSSHPLLLMCWLGLVTGFLELVLVFFQRQLLTSISLESLRINKYYVWMIPSANLLIFGVMGLILAVLHRHRPRIASTIACFGGTGLLAVAILQSIEVFHSTVGLVLACGIMVKAGPCLHRGKDLLRRWIRRSLPFLASGWVSIGACGTYWVATAEQRALSGLPEPSATMPNVLLLVMDDVRADSLGLYGNQRPTTPRLEGLARNAIQFDSARPTASWTLPSHASMFTGRWPHQMSIDWNRGLDDTHETLAQWLAGHGYSTAGLVGNTYYCNARYGLDRGFARYDDFYENRTVSAFEILHSTSLGQVILRVFGYSMNFEPGEKRSRKTAASINQDAIDWLANRPAGRPYFLFLNYYDAHAPFIPPEEAVQRFGKCALPRNEQVQILKKAARLSEIPESATLERARIEREANQVRQDGYESCIAYLDQQIGNLFDELRSRGMLENTLVIVTSDHGEHFQERGFSGHGKSLYRREIHVPLLIFPPGASKHVRVAEPVSLRELPATVADLLGLENESPFPGRSLSRFWRMAHESNPATQLVLSELGHQSTMAPNPAIPATMGATKALTTGRYVYLRDSNGREELYDRLEDPSERRNLIELADDGHPSQQVRERLSRMLDALKVPDPEAIDTERMMD